MYLEVGEDVQVGQLVVRRLARREGGEDNRIVHAHVAPRNPKGCPRTGKPSTGQSTGHLDQQAAVLPQNGCVAIACNAWQDDERWARIGRAYSCFGLLSVQLRACLQVEAQGKSCFEKCGKDAHDTTSMCYTVCFAETVNGNVTTGLAPMAIEQVVGPFVAGFAKDEGHGGCKNIMPGEHQYQYPE